MSMDGPRLRIGAMVRVTQAELPEVFEVVLVRGKAKRHSGIVLLGKNLLEAQCEYNRFSQETGWTADIERLSLSRLKRNLHRKR